MEGNIVLLLLFLTFASAINKIAESILEDGKECIAKINLEENYVDMIQKFKFQDEKPIRDYFQCFTDKLDLWNEKEKTINVEAIVDKYAFDLKKQDVRDIVTNCLSQQAPDWIVPFYQCLADSKLGSRVKHAQFMDEL